MAGTGHVTRHRLRNIYATALVNGGSLQTLMFILGHDSAQMSLRYGHLFDITVRTEHERALALAKSRIGAMPTTESHSPPSSTTWLSGPTIKTALAGSYCLHVPAQGACTYANICERCPSFHATAEDVGTP